MTRLDPEAAAKNYQVDSIKDDIAVLTRSVDRLIITVDEKLATKSELHNESEKLNVKIDTEIQSVHNKYEPTVKNLNWITKTTIGGVIALIISAVFQLMKNNGGQ